MKTVYSTCYDCRSPYATADLSREPPFKPDGDLVRTYLMSAACEVLDVTDALPVIFSWLQVSALLCIHKKVAEADIFATKDLQSTLHTNPMKSETVLSHDQCHVTNSQDRGGGGYGRFGLKLEILNVDQTASKWL